MFSRAGNPACPIPSPFPPQPSSPLSLPSLGTSSNFEEQVLIYQREDTESLLDFPPTTIPSLQRCFMCSMGISFMRTTGTPSGGFLFRFAHLFFSSSSRRTAGDVRLLKNTLRALSFPPSPVPDFPVVLCSCALS